MSENQSSYRQILKATSIFGGVQVFNIIISLIRSKVVAVLLGPAGMGTMGLLLSAVGLVASVTNLGLSGSAVRDISFAHTSGDQIRIGIVATVFRKWVWITGLLGMLITAFMAPLLSQYTFGNNEFTWAFILISVTLLLNQLTSGQNVVMQGTRHIKLLAKANIYSGLFSLITVLPMYYFWGENGIVPAIIIGSITVLLITTIIANKVKISKVEICNKVLWGEGKAMLKLGFFLSLSGLITAFSAYALRMFISNSGTLEDVGLYSAGFAIIGTYVGMIFSAMGTDYYPRLAAVAGDNSKLKQVANQQAEIALLILGPVLVVFVIFIKWVVILLYSEKFLPVTEMLGWAALGMFLKAASWAVGFIILSKGETKVFFWSEVFANFYLLLFNVAGYYFMGMLGLGISFMVAYFLIFIQVYIIARMRYSFSFQRNFYIIAFVLGLALAIALLATYLFSEYYIYFVAVPLIILTFAYSFLEINRRLDLIKFKK